MAATNSIEELLSSEVDENEVSALVGSLETRLASPTHKESSQDVTDSVVTPISAPATSERSGNTNTNNNGGSNNAGNTSNNSSKVGCGIGTTSVTGTNHINNTGTSPCVGTNIGIGGTTTATVMAVASGLSPLQPTSSTVSSPFSSIQAVSQGQKGISLVTAGGTQVNKNTQSLAKAPIDAQIIGISSILSSTQATTTATGSIISTVSPANITGTTTTNPGTSGSGVSLLGINTPSTTMQVPTNGGEKLGNTPTIRIINQGAIITSASSVVSTNNTNTQSQNVTYVHAVTRPLGPGQPQPAHVVTTDSNCAVTQQNSPVVSTGVAVKQGNHTASSAMYNLASIAAERKPLAVPTMTVHQAKPLQVGSRVTVREQIDQRQDKTGMPKITITTAANTSVTTTTPLIKTDSSGGHLLIKDVSKTDSTCTRDALTRATTTVVTVPQQNVHIVKSMTNSNLITVTRTQSQNVAVVPPQILTPTQMRIVTVNNQIQATRALTVNAGNLGKTTNSRVGTVRINPSPSPQQISIAPRPGGTNAITLPTSIQLQPGTVLVKNEQGQLVLVQASQASVLQPQTTTNTAVLPGKLHNTKTITTQGQPRQQTPTILTIQQPQSQVPTTTHHTVLRHSVPVNHTPIVSLHNSNVSTVSHTATASSTAVPGSVSVTQAGGVIPGQNSNMIDNVRKCKNFMATLLKLASNQRPETIMNVRELIQGLIDGKVDPESFTEKLQIELQSSPQPYLVPFLKKSLPLLRQSLYQNKMSIEGVRPPPQEVIRQPAGSPVPTITTVTSTRQTVQNQAQNRITSLPVTSTNLAGQPQVHSVVSSTHLHQPKQVSIACTMHARNMKINQPKTIVKHQLCPVSQVGHIQVRGHQGKVTTTTTMAHTGITVNKGNFSTVATTIGKTNLLNTLPTPVSNLQTHMPIKKEIPSTHKEKRKYESLKDDDDINDVATMGGVNLSEETRNIMATNAEFIGTQTRSCKDECFLYHSPLSSRVNAIAKKFGVDEVPSDVINLISHATQERLRDFVEKLSTIAEHRSEIYKMDNRYEVRNDVRSVLKHFEELDRLEKKRHEEQEREMLLRVAKSRSKHEDPEQLKLKQKAKELQQAEMEEMRQREANITALAAIGPRKKRKIEMGDTNQSGTSSSLTNGLHSSPLRPTMSRPRLKRVNLKDLIFLMEQDRSLCRSAVLYKTFFK